VSVVVPGAGELLPCSAMVTPVNATAATNAAMAALRVIELC